MGGSNPYDQTTVDWFRTRDLAHQVAQQTAVPAQDAIVYYSDGRPVEAVGRHWLLHAREHHLSEPFDTGAETQHVYYFAVLLPDGSLKTVTIQVEEDLRSNRDGTRTTQRFERKHSIEDLRERDATTWFDFEKSSYAREPDSENWKRYWGNLYGEQGPPLVRHKGEGLEQALRELLRGQAPEQWQATTLFTQPDQVPPPLPTASTFSTASPASGTQRAKPRKQGTNSLAGASMTASLAGILCVFPAAFGVLFGVIALLQIRNTGQQGQGLAIGGTVLGMAISIIWIAYLLSKFA
jgi:Domain of unknown function (DUF4190)